MAYGAGRSRLYAAVGQEQAREREQRERDIRLAERAREVESERKSLWSLGGSLLGGAVFGPVGIVGGTIAGKMIGGAGTYKGKAVESYKLGTDVGQFGVSEKAETAAINRDLARADRADVWRDIVDIGKTAATAYLMGGGEVGDPSDFSWTQFGGKEAGKKYGAGLFGKAGGGYGFGEGTLWSTLGSEAAVAGTPYVKPEILEADVSGVFDQSSGRLQIPGFAGYEGETNPSRQLWWGHQIPVWYHGR